MASEQEHRRDLVVVGASMGGIQALGNLLAGLEPGFPAAVLAVQHRSPFGPGNLDRILAARSPLPVAHARDGEALTAGEVRLAPPDHHLLVSGDRLRLVRGPTENRARPSIDALFRSAAATGGSRVMAVLLSGLLDDGSAGIAAVHHAGGITAVQAPEEALHPELPELALRRDHVRHVGTVAELAAILRKIAGQPVEPHPIPRDIRLEARLTERITSTPAEMDQLGEHTGQSCPECAGPMWGIGGGEEPLRYRCHIGHVLSGPWMAQSQREQIEAALFTALRVLEERSRLLAHLADQAASRDQDVLAANYRRRAAEVDSSLGPLRNLLANLGEDAPAA